MEQRASRDGAEERWRELGETRLGTEFSRGALQGRRRAQGSKLRVRQGAPSRDAASLRGEQRMGAMLEEEELGCSREAAMGTR